MNTNLSVTDGVYGILSDRDVRAEIADLSNLNNSNSEMTTDQLIDLVRQFLDRLESNSGLT